MVSLVSSGIRVSVETFYQQEYSNPLNKEYVFAYKIVLHNNNPFPVKLISRYWSIHDADAVHTEVEGSGVVGVQPILGPDKSFQYVSGCDLQSEIGKMSGAYMFEDIQQKKQFEVKIPVFLLVAPFKLN